MFILGIIIISAVIYLTTLMGANFDSNALGLLFDFPSIFFLIVVIVGVIISTGSFKTLIMAINALLFKKYNISAADKEKAIRLFKLLEKSTINATIIITVLGFMLCLVNLSDPSAIGPSFAVALYSIHLGAFVNLAIIHPAINVLETRYNKEEKRVISEKQVIDKLLELCYKQGISPEEIMNASEIFFKNHN